MWKNFCNLSNGVHSHLSVNDLNAEAIGAANDTMAMKGALRVNGKTFELTYRFCFSNRLLQLKLSGKCPLK